ncbi:GCN5 family acetyltransferase [Geobacillus sp. CAMR12739]|uniref:GNAT family N-acetyltransferase n=1 Tax=Geobacillus zalihae TaxID=213419 RepID=UPI0004A0E28B|nr:GNAT family N-acetyltransferase [Geobacillus zalihae]KDE48748.1 GCN5 family acetyltransferase [Geobacillus sp. CAMR12739]OQP18464.1 GNAT family N-acetyltransferase [Geobacillus zalihae]
MIREMKEEDLERVVEIVAANNPTLADLARRDISEGHRKETARFFVAEENRHVVGVMGYEKDRWGVQDIYWAIWLFVDPIWQRRGIATKLYGHIEEELRRLGCRKVYLDVGNESEHEAAIAFHKANGFVLEGYLRDYWSDGEDFLIFAKRLS